MSESGRGVLDTSVVIQLREFDRDTLPRDSVISAVTLAELTVGPLVATTPGQQALRQQHLQQAETDFEVLPFDRAAARAYASVAASMRSAGRKRSARALDALIAATAIAHGLPLYTSNTADFAGIDGLDLRVVRTATLPT